jgi:hypothetical protein
MLLKFSESSESCPCRRSELTWRQHENYERRENLLVPSEEVDSETNFEKYKVDLHVCLLSSRKNLRGKISSNVMTSISV